MTKPDPDTVELPPMEVAEAALKVLKHRGGIMLDIQSAHINRGAEASEWMYEADRDFRKDLREAFDGLTRALASTKDGGE